MNWQSERDIPFSCIRSIFKRLHNCSYPAFSCPLCSAFSTLSDRPEPHTHFNKGPSGAWHFSPEIHFSTWLQTPGCFIALWFSYPKRRKIARFASRLPSTSPLMLLMTDPKTDPNLWLCWAADPLQHSAVCWMKRKVNTFFKNPSVLFLFCSRQKWSLAISVTGTYKSPSNPFCKDRENRAEVQEDLHTCFMFTLNFYRSMQVYHVLKQSKSRKLTSIWG